MIFQQVVLDDFNIFYGKQTLELGAGLYVIHGENGRGKSTFLNAISWVLFGEFFNRQGQPVSPSVMLNREARLEGKQTFSVELRMLDGQDKLRVKRSFDLANAAAGVQLSVERNGAPLNRDDGEQLLRSLLDQDVSRFFLFDGEDLRRYEELLFGAGAEATEVRRSLEHILGLPALTNAVSDLDAVAEEFETQAVKASRKETTAQQAALAAEQLKKDLEDAESDLNGLLENKTKLEADIATATAVLQQHEASTDLLNKKVAIESALHTLKDELVTHRATREDVFARVWKDVLAAAVRPERDRLEETLVEEQQRQAWKHEADVIRAALETSKCGQCGQKVHGDAAAKLTARLAELDAKPAPSGPDMDAVSALAQLSAIAPAGHVTQAINIDSQVGKTNTKISQLQQQLEDLVQETAGIPEAELRDAADKRDQANKLIGVNEEKIDEQKTKIASTKSNLKIARDKLAQASTNQQAAELRARATLTRELKDTYEAAKDQFRDEMRKKVGKDASEIFSSLTSTPAYKGLEINANYGLTTLGPDGKPVPGRSAGQEQIVAFSLIGALNRNATRTAPVIMDTPLGRLDETHKAKVLQHLASFAEQVFLLVHSGEVPDQALVPIRSSIIAEYDLHDDDLFKTQIRKRTTS
jgi:DNA sulfur modification protein DndD